jgi:uncharacterized membrane protein YgcG
LHYDSMMRRVLPHLLIAGLLAASPARADEGWVINRLDIRYTIQPDASIQVAEALDVDFRNLQRHGIFRDLVYLQPYDQTTNREYDIHIEGVIDGSGRQQPVKRTTDGALARFRIGDPSRTVSGPQTYRIAYRLGGALNAFPDRDELYWNATGTWPVAISRAIVRVDTPADAIERVACFEGAAGSTTPCRVTFTPDEATFTATRPLAAGEQLTIVAGLRKGAVAAPVPHLVPRPRDVLHFFDRTAAYLSILLVGLAAAVGGIGTLWWRLGRDRRYTSIQYLSGTTDQERVPLFASDPIVVEFEPPDGLRPGQMGLLFDERADTLDVTATIVDLAVRGYLRISELPKSGVLAWFGKPDYQLDRLKAPDSNLLDYERIVLDGLFFSGETRKLSELRNTFYTDLARAKTALYADAVTRGWFPRNPNIVRGSWAAAGLLVGGAGVALTIYLGYWWGAGLVGVPVAAAGLLLVLMARAMPRRTAKGREATRRALGFARYIRTAEQHQQAFAERANIFTSYLPYAIAMKCVDKWARAFRDIDLQQATTGWYVGTSRFDAGTFSSNLATFSDSVSSAIASTPGGSGGSGFGGSSGGGGGGGGGGSW